METPKQQPTLYTTRLVLRPFDAADAPTVKRLLDTPEVAATTLNIPYPYPDGAAEQWIARRAELYASGDVVSFAIIQRASNEVVGAISMHITANFRHAELGYWLGVPYWNLGYMTEAAGAMLGYGFVTLDLHRIIARHLTRNPASGRVMQKIGMTFEGIQREHVLKGDRFEDLACYGILRHEWHMKSESV